MLVVVLIFVTTLPVVGGVRFELTKPEATVLQTARFEPLAYPPIKMARSVGVEPTSLGS